MNLTNLSPPEGATSSKKRKGRGQGSTLGKTAGKGQKGQNSRSGGGVRPGFEGGQMPLQRRVPKQGFTNPNAKVVETVNVSELERVFEAGAEVGPEELVAHRLVRRRYDKIKVLGTGDLTKGLTIRAHQFSKGALEKITAAGGSAEVIGGE